MMETRSDATETTGQFWVGKRREIAVPVADMNRAPDGPRDRQVLLGAQVDVFEACDDHCMVQTVADGYTGYVHADTLRTPTAPTHRVCAPATHLYEQPDFKSRNLARLSLGAQLFVVSQSGNFYETPDGFVPKQHLCEAASFSDDPVAVASLLLGTPYLWGGNSSDGIDCSGLVQAACHACGIPCPGDSGMQLDALGQHIPADAPLERNDLLFWKGHVAWVVAPDMLLHANVFHMAVAYEKLDQAIKRIAGQGDGPVIARKRLSLERGSS